MIVPATGCAADGVTDDRLPLQAAINVAAANGDILLLDGKTYAVSAPGLTIPTNTSILGTRGLSSIKAIGGGWNGAILTTPIAGAGFAGSTSIIGSDGGAFLCKPASYVAVQDPTIFHAGLYVVIETKSQFQLGTTPTHRQIAQIRSISGNRLYFVSPIYIPTSGITCTAYLINLTPGITIRDITLDGSGGTIAPGGVLQGMYAFSYRDSYISLAAHDFPNSGWISWYGYNNRAGSIDTDGCGSGGDAAIYPGGETGFRADLLRAYRPNTFGVLMVNMVMFEIGKTEMMYGSGRGLKTDECIEGLFTRTVAGNVTTGVSIQAACGRLTFLEGACHNNNAGGFAINGTGSQYINVHNFSCYSNSPSDFAIETDNFDCHFYNASSGSVIDDQGTRTVFNP